MDTYLNIESMTDEQLSEYVAGLNIKLATVSRLPNGSGAVDQIRRLQEIARAVMLDRANARAFKQLIASRPAEIVTDPSLVPEKDDKTVAPSPQKPQFNRVQVRRSDRPLSQIDLNPSPPSKD